MELIVIQDKIYTVRSTKVMIDRGLASLYGVETRVLNQAIKRNKAGSTMNNVMPITNVEFEVSLQEQQTSGGEAKVGVLFGALGIGGKAEDSSSRLSNTKVRFNIPMVVAGQQQCAATQADR